MRPRGAQRDLLRIDPRTEQTLSRIEVTGEAMGIFVELGMAAGADSLWITTNFN